MSWRRVRALLGKEWAEARRNRAVTWTFLFVAGVLTAVPLVMAFGFFPALAHDLEAAPRTTVLLGLLQRLHPELAALAPSARLQALLLRQFLSLFLVLPILGAMTVATYSVVGERASRSLEPLLATPLSTGELLLGKSLAAALPAALGSWAAFGIFAAATALLGGLRLAAVVVDSTSLLTMLLVTPLLALFGMAAGVLVSLRARDPRGAQQVGGLLVLPVIALVAAQISGVVLLGPTGVLAGAAVLLLLDAALLAWGVRLFDRERLFVELR